MPPDESTASAPSPPAHPTMDQSPLRPSRISISSLPHLNLRTHHLQSNRTVVPGIADPLYGDNAVVSSKYTWLNMLPKAIFEQFRRISNLYFLIVAAVSFIPNISPSSPITTTLPLVVVIGFGLARDIYEDFLRKRADAVSNNRPVLILNRREETNQKLRNPRPVPAQHPLHVLSRLDGLNPDHYTPVRSRDIAVGDILLLLDGDHIPADVIVLASAHNSSECFVSTANLDGESNLKRRSGPRFTTTLTTPSASSLHVILQESLSTSVTVSPPTASLYQLEGCLSTSAGVSTPLDERNLLLRGSVLRNTLHVHAVVVYAGVHTKLALNMRDPPSKLGGVERVMNRVVIALFFILLLLTVITSAIAGAWHAASGHAQWYMGDNSLLSASTVGLRSLGTYLILYHTFVPVSLFVTLEFTRLVQGLFIVWDARMRTSDGAGADVRANNLNETLGYVDHIFSDKTGTLTQNVMRFVSAVLPCGETHDARNSAGLNAFREAVGTREDALSFVNAMAIAHDVVPAYVQHSDSDDDKDKGSTHDDVIRDIEYQGESVDEVALVEGACDAGVSLQTRDDEGVIEVRHESTNDDLRFESLGTLEFTSERKRMSVVVRDHAGVVRVITKGADSVMIPLLVSPAAAEEAQRAADTLSRDGLRTLVYGERIVPDDELVEWLQEFREAANAIEGRTELKAKAAAKIEHGLKLLGVTGIEDLLQDNVGGSIVFLRKAGIRIWVLTGDKVETAENIGYSSMLLSRDMKVTMARCKMESELEMVLREALVRQGKDSSDSSIVEEEIPSRRWMPMFGTFGQKRTRTTGSHAVGEHALIIDGETLALVAKPELERLFVDVAMGCRTVICARVTPLQKARVVKLVRRYEGSNTLAIGDGGNDVSMIQEAHIGVGIKGKEGAQAARAADYALSEFQHLVRLVAVHGRYSYLRTAGVINLSFYKNVFFSCTQFLFQFFCFASGTTFHNQWIVTAWNAILTLVPPFFYGIFERDLDDDTLLRFPEVYKSNRGNKLFSLRTVMEFTIAYSVWHALVLFWLTLWAFGDRTRTVFTNGQDAGFFLTGLGVSIMAVCIALFKILLSSHLWTRFVLGGVTVSFALLWGLIALFPVLFHEVELDGVLSRLMMSPAYHLLWPVVFVTAFVPDFMVKLRRSFRFSLVERLQLWEARGKKRS